jgi:hypothetical protein
MRTADDWSPTYVRRRSSCSDFIASGMCIIPVSHQFFQFMPGISSGNQFSISYTRSTPLARNTDRSRASRSMSTPRDAHVDSLNTARHEVGTGDVVLVADLQKAAGKHGPILTVRPVGSVGSCCRCRFDPIGPIGALELKEVFAVGFW